MLIQLAYVSSTPKLLEASDLTDILVKSRQNNARQNVTGLLVYHDGNILQFLEGEEENVSPLFARISQDPRHRGVIKLYQERIDERDFPEWSMGFTDTPGAALKSLDGYSEVMDRKFDLRTISAHKARQLLKVFKASA